MHGYETSKDFWSTYICFYRCQKSIFWDKMLEKFVPIWPRWEMHKTSISSHATNVSELSRISKCWFSCYFEHIQTMSCWNRKSVKSARLFLTTAEYWSHAAISLKVLWLCILCILCNVNILAMVVSAWHIRLSLPFYNIAYRHVYPCSVVQNNNTSNRQCTYNVILWDVRVTIVAV